MADEQIRDANRSSTNPGIDPVLNTLPNVEIHRGTPDQFSRPATYLPGHARLSPGDGRYESKPAAKSEQPGKADPMTDPTPTPHPVRAEDFARGFSENVPGNIRPSPGSPTVRGPMSPEEALFGGNRKQFDFGQLQDATPGKLDNNDAATLGRVDSPHPARPAVTKTPEATQPWGPPDAWSKEKDK